MGGIVRASYKLCAWALLLFACHTPAEPDPFEVRAIPSTLREPVAEVVAANNAFACELYRVVCTEPGNLITSPYSVATALSMAYAGAAGTTGEEMGRVLHVPLGASHWHEASGALLESLNRGVSLGGYELSIANRLWGQTGYSFLEGLLAILRDAYEAPLELVDFAHDPEAARRLINRWVEGQTKGRITDVMPPGVITSLTRLVLANAIFFKGTWETRFDPDRTTSGPFWVSPGRSVLVPLMHMDHRLHRYASFPTFEVLELPYRGGDLSMVLVLPSEVDGLAALEAALSATMVEEWYAALGVQRIAVVLPKWSFAATFRLAEKLSTLGMPSAFDPMAADFSGMNGQRDLFLQEIVHKAFVAVNEEGTEASAATGIAVGITSAGSTFEATHPFLFLIRDNVTGSILFLGRVVDPTAPE